MIDVERELYELKQKVEQLEKKVIFKDEEIEITIPYLDFGIDELKQLPKRGRSGDCGYDAYCVKDTIVPAHSTAKVPLGIGFIIPTPFGIKAETRGGNHLKGLNVAKAWVDRNFRGEINALMQNITDKDIIIKRGDRPCSIDLIMSYKMNFVPAKDYFTEDEYNELMNTERGDKGFGSSGE